MLDHCRTVADSIQIAEGVLATLAVFDYEKSVEMRSAKGGTSKACVLEQIAVLRGMLE